MGLFWNLEEFSENRENKIKWIEERYKEETRFRKFLREDIHLILIWFMKIPFFKHDYK